MQRGVWQLQKLTINYCEWGGSSKGVRDYVQSGLIDFAKKNPQMQIVAQAVKGNKHPHAIASYINGVEQTMPLRNFVPVDVEVALTTLRNRSGRRFRSLKPWATPKSAYPSIQGVWRPDLFVQQPPPKPEESKNEYFKYEVVPGRVYQLPSQTWQDELERSRTDKTEAAETDEFLVGVEKAKKRT